jgi:hypothetical protein
MRPLLIRLSDAERSLIDRLVAAGRGSRAAIVREALLVFGGQAAVRDPAHDRALQDLSVAYGRVGISLNQIARRLNAGDDVDAAALGTALTRLISLNEATRQELRAAAMAGRSFASNGNLLVSSDRGRRG